VCDVYENDIQSSTRPGSEDYDHAYPGRPLAGRVSDIGHLDPSSRTAKVRIEVANLVFLKLGCCQANFTSQ